MVTETQKQIKQETPIETPVETPNLLFLAQIPVDVIVDPENFAYPGCRLFGGNDSKIKNWLEPDKSKLNDIIEFYVQASLISDLVELDYNQFNNNNVGGRENNQIWITACTCEEYEIIQQLVNKYKVNLSGGFGHRNMDGLPLQDCPNVPEY